MDGSLPQSPYFIAYSKGEGSDDAVAKGKGQPRALVIAARGPDADAETAALIRLATRGLCRNASPFGRKSKQRTDGVIEAETRAISLMFCTATSPPSPYYRSLVYGRSQSVADVGSDRREWWWCDPRCLVFGDAGTTGSVPTTTTTTAASAMA
jgi:hypothetical protein